MRHGHYTPTEARLRSGRAELPCLPIRRIGVRMALFKNTESACRRRGRGRGRVLRPPPTAGLGDLPVGQEHPTGSVDPALRAPRIEKAERRVWAAGQLPPAGLLPGSSTRCLRAPTCVVLQARPLFLWFVVRGKLRECYDLLPTCYLLKRDTPNQT